MDAHTSCRRAGLAPDHLPRIRDRRLLGRHREPDSALRAAGGRRSRAWDTTNRMTAYYNEIDPYAAQWLRNLIAAGHIAPGVVDERDIREIRSDDLTGFTQCHFFAGIGVWSRALRGAGWP